MLARARRAAPFAALLLACSGPAGHAPPRAPLGAGAEPDAPGVAAAAASPPPAAPAGAVAGGDGETGGSDDDTDDEESVDDVETALPPDAIAIPHPLDGVSAKEIDRRVVSDPASLGSMSVGRPNAGRLINGVQMADGPAWTVVAPGAAWATDETAQALGAAITKVASAFPGTPKLPIGDISVEHGGYLAPHLSHQAGRDVDIGYYYLKDERWYRRATAENLDLPRTWAFVRALITDTDVEMLLIDHSIQALLRDHAERIGEDRRWLDLLFRGRGAVPPLIRHAPGHATHIHIRFYSPLAQETARRAYASLVSHGKISAGASFVTHVAKKGETLARLAKRYHTTVRIIRQANGLRSNAIQAKRTYRIPVPHGAAPALQMARVVIPPRRLPPSEKGAPRAAAGASPEASL